MCKDIYKHAEFEKTKESKRRKRRKETTRKRKKMGPWLMPSHIWV